MFKEGYLELSKLIFLFGYDTYFWSKIIEVPIFNDAMLWVLKGAVKFVGSIGLLDWKGISLPKTTKFEVLNRGLLEAYSKEPEMYSPFNTSWE